MKENKTTQLHGLRLGEVSNSQKLAIITLLEKKDKDKRVIANWRPISLINVDVNIGAKAIAQRLQNSATKHNLP